VVHSTDVGRGKYVCVNVVITCHFDVCRPAATTTQCEMHGGLLSLAMRDAWGTAVISKDQTVYCTTTFVTDPALWDWLTVYPVNC